MNKLLAIVFLCSITVFSLRSFAITDYSKEECLQRLIHSRGSDIGLGAYDDVDFLMSEMELEIPYGILDLEDHKFVYGAIKSTNYYIYDVGEAYDMGLFLIITDQSCKEHFAEFIWEA